MLRRDLGQLPSRLWKMAAGMATMLAAIACLAVASGGPPKLAAGANGPARVDVHGDPLPAGALARLGTTRLRHGRDVTFVSFGPNGKTLVTAGRDSTVRLWDLATGKEIRRFTRPKPGPQKAAKDSKDRNLRLKIAMQLIGGGQADNRSLILAFTPDGKTLAIAGVNVIQLLDVQTGQERRTIQDTPGNVIGLLFSPDGRTLAGRTFGGSLVLWAAATGQQLHKIKPPPREQANALVLTFGGGLRAAPGMAFTPDGKLLAAAATDYKKQEAIDSVKFWDVTTGKEIRKIPVPRGVRVAAVAITADGKFLAYGSGGVVHLCEANTGKEIRQLKAPDGGIVALAFTPDGKSLAARGRNQRVRLWETETGKEIHRFGEPEPERGLSGNIAFVGGAPAGPEMRALAISPDGKRIAAAAGNTVRLWERATGKELPLVGGHRRAPTAIALSPDSKTVVSWGGDRVVRRWDAATGRPLGAFPAPAQTTLAAFTADGRAVAFANADRTIRLHDTATGKELHRLAASRGGVSALTFTRDGKVLAARRGDNTVRLYDVARGTEMRQIALAPPGNPGRGVLIIGGPGGNARGTGPGLVFSPDGKLLAVSGGSPVNRVLLIDVASGKALRQMKSPQAIKSFAFSPDGRSLATENADRTVTLWEVASTSERGRLGKPAAQRAQANPGMGGLAVVLDGMPAAPSQPAGPVGLVFSPDGQTLATRGPDGSVCVLDVTVGKEIRRFTGHAGAVITVAQAHDGKLLASGSADTTILLWATADLSKGLATLPGGRLSAAEVKALWKDLAGADGVKALASVLRLANTPAQAVPFLREHLRPAVTVERRKIEGWIADLESRKFSVRENASRSLLKVGEQAIPALRKLLESPPSQETRSRAEGLLQKLTSGTLTTEQLRMVRAVEALERMATPEARMVLRTLARGAPGALPTREAQAALGRLERQP